MTTTAWQPLADQILVRPLIPADRSAGGIVLAETNRERPQQGVVLAVGPGEYLDRAFRECQVHTGDLVSFGKYAGIDFELDGEIVLLMRDREALARKVAGTFALVEHTLPHNGRVVAHEAGRQCEHCPVEKSAVLEEERRRLLGSIDDRPVEVIGDGTGVR
jgi:chaperonin GroES